MDALATFFDDLKKSGQPEANFLGLLHVLIGRSITRVHDKVVVSKGMTWRELAGWLKKARWDTESVRELGLDPKELPPRDRQRLWYSAIMQAKINGPAAQAAGERFAVALAKLGYEVGAVPHA